MKNLQRIIKQIALENNLSYEVLSCDLIIKLTKDNKIRYINGYKFGLNSHSLGLILDDKYATYELLNSLNIKVCKHHILFRPNNHNSYAKNYNSFKYCYDLFLKYNKNVILKVNNGTCGDGVYHITTKNKLKKIYKLIEKELIEKYKLKLNKNKCKIVSIKEGFVFLGYRYKVLNKKTIIKIEKLSKKRIIKRIKEVKYLYKNNYINLETFFTSINTFLNIYKVNKGVIYRNINKYIFNKSSEFNK